ncbi:MAG: response regulator, partial [Campylobacterota bacterium]|nr:response regulator [Campylobacterota bacterium]
MLSDNILQFASTLKILYVEDHKETREAMIQILEDIFGVVCVGVDGEDGLEKFQKETFSLIISDINMPKLNGIEMLKRIRHINKKIPILILSANSETNYFVETIRLGIEGYLLKPIEIDQFDFMIEKTLEKIILEKERQYYEEELIHSNRQLELIAKAKDEFLANMSHEIRTPMNAIIGLSYILLQGDLKPKQEDYINKIHTSGNLLLGIINDILDFSKIEAGKLDIENIDFSLSSVLNNVSNIIGSKAKEKNLELIFDIEQNLPSTFRGDPIRLGQIIINLMSNAIKFTNEGEVNLRIRTQEISAIKEIIKFEVIDTGIGIKDEDLRRLFDSFAQADSSVNRQYGGTGLGLSISKQLVELMGGDIEVESEYGSGSHFSFSVEFEAIGNREIENFELPSSILSNKKVLIINQNSSTSSALSKILSSFSYDCVLASTIEEAEALIEANKFASIYIEREMLLHCSAEKIPYYKQIKIIILESVFEFENDEYYNGLVPDARLEKPFTKEMVYRAILGSYSDKNLAKSETESIIDDSSGHIATRSILLAEDNKINQAVILGLLENSGIDLIIANNGKEAVDILRKNNQISLVLMDINMPVMNGYEATKIIREDLGYTTLPIIAIT